MLFYSSQNFMKDQQLIIQFYTVFFYVFFFFKLRAWRWPNLGRNMSPYYTYRLRSLIKLAVVRPIFILHAHIIDTKWDVTHKSHPILLFTTYYYHHNHYAHRHCHHHQHHHHHQAAVPFCWFCLSQSHTLMRHDNMQVSRWPMVSTISFSSQFFKNIKSFRRQTGILMSWICMCYCKVRFTLNPSVCLSPTFLHILFISV